VITRGFHGTAKHVHVPSKGSASDPVNTDGNQCEAASDERRIYFGKGNAMKEFKGE
jgi:hypothetical protein